MTDSALRLYFENPVGRVLEHPGGFAVVLYHPGKRKLHHLQAFLTHTSRLLQLRNWNKLLGDQRLMAPFTDEESQWIVGYWLSQERQDSTIYGAVLLPNDVFARLSVNNMMHEAKAAALTYRMFDNEPDAIAWLVRQP
ncbi:hypothetical protein [Hymenobacter latericus]|uniref:hypothetical protein n=1 Tax=Hymenobacter sp. YIM 151858-1 TaxID=2987688 RepID=UPI0022270848|nr:hypothetical protein [Hymenobacter sp. YIM 151858-1]UYZ59729.1 hypothetical protein OIS50_02760 [Hymenobacter sp. YIM 151858-1]